MSTPDGGSTGITDLGAPGPNPLAPVVILQRLERIGTVEMLVSDLEALVQAGEREQLAGQFFMLFSGALVATATAWGTADEVTDRAFGVYVGACLALGGLSFGMAAFWWLERRARVAIRRRLLPLREAASQ